MYKKLLIPLLLAFIVIGAASAADFKINEGFTPQTEYFSTNDDGMYLCTWDYDDEMTREAYLENSTGYFIIEGDNNTYNTTYDTGNGVQDVISYVTSGNLATDCGVLEIAEYDGKKYIFFVYKESGSPKDWKACYDELMKFNENNKIEPIADAI